MSAWLESATSAIKAAQLATQLRRTHTQEELRLLIATLQRLEAGQAPSSALEPFGEAMRSGR